MGIDENAIAKSIFEKVNKQLVDAQVAEFKKIENEFHKIASYMNLLEQRIIKLEKK